MASKRIRRFGDPILRKKAQEVKAFGPELTALIEEMFAVMRENDGVGLAAPQIGYSLSVIVAEPPAEEGGRKVAYALINPAIVFREGSVSMEEGCLSIPGVRGWVERPESIVVTGFDAKGNKVTLECENLLARILCHEIDHLNGILFVDRLEPFERELVEEKLKEITESGAPGVA